jgi:hypothetical protein
MEGEDPQVQGTFYKDTALCIQNNSAEAVDVRFGQKPYPGRDQEIYWYWDALRAGKKNSGVFTLNPDQRACNTSATFSGLMDSSKVSLYFKNGAIARMGAENSALGSPKFYPTLKGDDWAIGWDSKSFNLNEYKSMLCQSQEYDFLVTRLVDSKDEKNWLVELQGPTDPDYWPNEICVAR